MTPHGIKAVDRREFLGVGGLVLAGLGGTAANESAVLPDGVKAVWDLAKAHRERRSTRERVCLNGLWRWQPATSAGDAVPEAGWGYFKVPGFWPGESSCIQEDTQTLFAHPTWKDADLRNTTAAWYQRELEVPADWAGQRIAVAAEYVNSIAVVFLDGTKAGEVRFPAGEVDLTARCRPGGKYSLSLLVRALPLKAVLLSYADTNSAREVAGSVERRGLCGDVFLTGVPAGPRLTDVKVDTSVRKGEITVHAAVADPAAGHALRVTIRQDGRSVREFAGGQLRDGGLGVTEAWKPNQLWDVHTPRHTLTAEVSLVDAAGKVLDVFHAVRFGFREFWIDGRDFYLNGSRLYLSAVPLDNALVGARTATYEATRETLQRLRRIGINFVYTHNYGCEPGSHVSSAEVLRAADDVGMLVAFSQPHFGHYDWKAADADRANGYARHAAFYVRAAQNHPSVVAYAMSHNATGYDEDMNPDLIDGIQNPRDDQWSRNGAALARRAEAIVSLLDSSRVVYHHSSGNLGLMHTANFYLNFVPVQELCDWFEHWATKGVKPVFTCEYGVPFTWDWTMYRGWYKGQREWGSARIPWEFCFAEWNAQFLGDRAYRIGEAEKRNLRWEREQFRAGRLWHRWDYPNPLGSPVFDDQQEVLARYFRDAWRAFRTWGVSANSPWEYEAFWKVRAGADRRRKDFPVDWDKLQRPGFSPDYTQRREWQVSVYGERADWLPTAAAQALIRNNRPLLAYVGGAAGKFTSKDHIFRPGESFDKQLILVNNSRAPVTCEYEWSLGLPQSVGGRKTASVATGSLERIPLHFELPEDLPAGNYEVRATVRFGGEETQTDNFRVTVLPRPVAVPKSSRFALWDSRGETQKLLSDLGVSFDPAKAGTDLAGYDVLVVGKGALTPGGPGPDVRRVRDGLKVIVFEQPGAVLEGRLGFRVAEYGLRQLFPRVPDHSLLAGLDAELLRDWRGSATLLPPRLQYKLRPRYGPTVKWCGLDVPRAWRAGCRGNVASVLIEKPARGDFLPVLDGGFGLQYAALLEYREGNGIVLFCQADVTGRTEGEPAADVLVRNLLRYVAGWKPRPRRKAVYAGEPAGRRHLEASAIPLAAYAKDELAADRLLIVGPGGGRELAGDRSAVAEWLREGGRLLALGLDGAEIESFLPGKVTSRRGEHIAAFFEPPGVASPFAGVGPADIHNRDPRELSLVAGGVAVLGNGVLARADRANVVFCQLVPWQFDPAKGMNQKRTFRRASYLVARLAANLGAPGATPLLDRIQVPIEGSPREGRWLNGLYLDTPEEWDDPYRFFRW